MSELVINPGIEIRNTQLELHQFRLRLAILAGFVLVMFALLCVRFFYLQVVMHAHYQTLAEANRISIVPIAPNRGVIVDRNGVVLAHTRTRERTVIEPNPLRTLDVKPEHMRIVKDALVDVNKEGTGSRAFAGAEYVSAGKTGTAQVIGIKQGEKYVESRVDERFRDHSLFIAYAPADKPRIALAVIVENAGFGARAAAPIARLVFDYYLLGKQPARPAKDDEDATGQ